MIYDEVVREIRRAEGVLPRRTLSRHRKFGEHKSAAKGRGPDFYQFRDYDPTRDSASQIVWMLKPEETSPVYVREAKVTRDFPLLFAIDLSSSMESGIISRKLRLMLESAGILGLTAIHNQDRVGFIGFTDKILISERPRGGENNFYYLLSQICGFFEKSWSNKSARRTDLWQVLRYIERNFPCPHLVAVLSDFVGLEEIADYPLIRSRHEFIFFILEDEEEFSALGGSGTIRLGNMETGEEASVSSGKIASLKCHLKEKRDGFSDKLKKQGVDSLVLRYGGHFEALAKFIAERRLRA